MENILRLCASECKGDVKRNRDAQRARSLQVRIVRDFQGSRVGADDALQFLRPKRLYGHAKNLWTGLVQATNVDFLRDNVVGLPPV